MRLKTIFLGLSGLVSITPGIAGFVSGVGIPPGDELLFAGVLELFAVLSLLVAWVLAGRITLEWLKRYILRIYFSCMLGVVVLLGFYLWLLTLCVVQVEDHSPVLFPLWITSGSELEEWVEREGGRYEVVEKYGEAPARAWVKKMPGYAFVRIVTLVLLLLPYQLIFSLTSVVITVLSLHVGPQMFGKG